jgi:hypothetical protein
MGGVLFGLIGRGDVLFEETLDDRLPLDALRNNDVGIRLEESFSNASVLFLLAFISVVSLVPMMVIFLVIVSTLKISPSLLCETSDPSDDTNLLLLLLPKERTLSNSSSSSSDLLEEEGVPEFV